MANRSAPEPTEWFLCSKCYTPVYGRRWLRHLRVCPECSWHHPMSARQRLDHLLDPGSERPIPCGVTSGDPLEFTDRIPYPRRLALARADTGLDEAVLAATGTIDGVPLALAVMDFRFLGGSLGAAVGELITLTAETALAERLPLVIVTASGGARMQEGAIALMQMAKTSAALGQVDQAGLLTVSVITDPTYGGVAASFATLTDVIIAEPGARLGFAGRRVIAQTIRAELPPDFQTAQFLKEHGQVDMIVPRARLRAELGKLLAATTGLPIRPGPAGRSEVISDPADLAVVEPITQVRLARDLGRPTTLDYIGMVFDDFVELSGDRLSGDCPAMVAGIGWLDRVPLVVIGHQKGHDGAELARRNFGMATPAGYRKAARLMRLAAKLGLPVVTLVDTPGAYPGAEAEERGQSGAIAENLRLMAGLPVPVVSVITGEGGSGGALGIAVANRVLMFANSVYSVISPEGCAAILWHDPAATATAAAALRLTARELLELGVVDGVIPEPDGGTGADSRTAASRLRAVLVVELTRLSMMDPTGLVADRWARFRRFGAESASWDETAMREGAV